MTLINPIILTEVGMGVEEDTYVVIEEEVSDLTEGFQNRSLQLVDSIHGGVKQFRLESPGPFNSHPIQRVCDLLKLKLALLLKISDFYVLCCL